MNMSRFSLNLTSKTCNIDEYGFMRRNDLFNNNHSRQTTTIPLIKVEPGTVYSEVEWKQQVSAKDSNRTTVHSEGKCRFKNYTALDRMRAQSCHIKPEGQSL